jgi:hypothetical protein
VRVNLSRGRSQVVAGRDGTSRGEPERQYLEETPMCAGNYLSAMGFFPARFLARTTLFLGGWNPSFSPFRRAGRLLSGAARHFFVVALVPWCRQAEALISHCLSCTARVHCCLATDEQRVVNA